MDYDNFATVLADSGYAGRVAEWHGVLCGLLCAGRPLNSQTWFSTALSQINEEGEVPDAAKDTLDRVVRHTRQQLDSGEVEFEPILPGDEQTLAYRADALGVWCDAFLYGLAAGGVDRETVMSTEAAEFVEDLAEFGKIHHDESETEEKDEFYFAELLEYVRVGTLLLYDEFNAGMNAEQTVH